MHTLLCLKVSINHRVNPAKSSDDSVRQLFPVQLGCVPGIRHKPALLSSSPRTMGLRKSVWLGDIISRKLAWNGMEIFHLPLTPTSPSIIQIRLTPGNLERQTPEELLLGSVGKRASTFNVFIWKIFSYSLTCLLTYLHYLLTQSLTDLLTHLLTYLLIHSFTMPSLLCMHATLALLPLLATKCANSIKL